VHGGVSIGGFAEVVDPVDELLAVSEPNGVCAGQSHHLLHRETLLGELLNDLVHGHVGRGKAFDHFCSVRIKAVFSPQHHGIVGSTHHLDKVSGGLCHDVGTRNDAGACELERVLDLDYDVEGVAGEGEVEVRITFCMGVVGVGGDEDGAVAAVGYAVVEEEAENTGCCGGACALLGVDVFHYDFWEVWACFFVVISVEICVGEWEGEEEKEEEWESHGGVR